MCDLHRRLNSDLLLTAAIVHDIGRTREFTYGAEIGLTEQGRLLGHLTLGQQLLSERFAALGGALDEPRQLALLHCVLSHHGPTAAPGGRFGSPEALALYRLNALDAGVKGALEHGLPQRPWRGCALAQVPVAGRLGAARRGRRARFAGRRGSTAT